MGAVVAFKHTGASPVQDGRRRFDLFPRCHRQQWLYAVGLPDGRIKLGISSRPRKRVQSYWHQHEGGIQWAHLFGPVGSEKASRRVEGAAVAALSLVANRIGRSEYFRYLDKGTMLRVVRAVVLAHRQG
jgi:hypothetical protein